MFSKVSSAWHLPNKHENKLNEVYTNIQEAYKAIPQPYYTTLSATIVLGMKWIWYVITRGSKSVLQDCFNALTGTYSKYKQHV